MLYYSTNHHSDKVTFKEAMLHSEAPDGGLYMPERLPVIPRAFINNMSEMTMADICYVVTNMLLGQDLPSQTIKSLGEQALSFPMPLKQIEPGIYVMELFHGPTHTVKDIGARYLAGALQALYGRETGKPLNVLISTNGNSGNAVANVFNDAPGVNVFALYPRALHKQQIAGLNSYGNNIHTIEVNGHLDNCAHMIHRVGLDPEMDAMGFTAANSFNIGHLLPYTVVYFGAMAQLRKISCTKGDVYFSIPTGSGGNLCGAYMAHKMGLDVTHIIAACNQNSGLPGLLRRGVECHSEAAERSLAYSMDTPRTAGMPRLLEMCDGDMERLRRMISAETCSDAEIIEAIADVHARTGYMLDPHSAVAYVCLKKQKPEGATGVFFATACPSRSSRVVDSIIRTGKVGTEALETGAVTRASVSIPPTYGALKRYLKNTAPKKSRG